jgi:GABA(A) receptor-associated protein
MFFDKKKIDLDKRISESNRIICKFPDKIPVIVETDDKDLIKQMKKNKFLSPYDISVSHFMYSIRRQLNLNASQALFLFCDNSLINGTDIMGRIYGEYKLKNNINEGGDKFLYVQVSKENTFG